MTVLEIVTARVEGLDISAPTIQMSIDEVAQAIKNYCSITVIPEELLYTHSNMTEDLLRYRHARANADSGTTTTPTMANVVDLKIGDTNIKLGDANVSKSSELKAHRIDVDSLVLDYKGQLNKFRRLVW